MSDVPRKAWIEWLDELAVDGPTRVEAHPGGDSAEGILTRIDYDPFDDVLEVVVSTSGSLKRFLLDAPTTISADRHRAPRSITVRSRHGSIAVCSPRSEETALTRRTAAPEGV